MAVLAAVFFWLYTGPQRALRDIKVAANAGDVEGVREHVDVPALKESLKEQLSSMMQQKLANDSELKNNPFGGLGMLFAGKMVETMVDEAVTPTHLVALIQGDRKKAFGKSDETASTPSSLDLATNPNFSGSYDSSDRYTIKMLDKDTKEPTGALTMRREGLTWKLTAVQLPMDEVMKD